MLSSGLASSGVSPLRETQTVATRPSGTATRPRTSSGLSMAVLASFYDDRLAAGDGPMLNPVPAATGRDGQRPWAHHNPMHPAPSFRRAPLRQKVPMVKGRGVPDGLFDELSKR